MNDTFMKEKPVLPLILSMFLPMVLSMLVNSLYNIIVPGSRKHENDHDQPDVRVHHKHCLGPRSDFWLWPIPGNGN